MPTAKDTLWDTRFARPGVNLTDTKIDCMVANAKYLYASGDYTNIGPHRTRGLMRWDGNTWEDLSQGFAIRNRKGEHQRISIFSMALDSSGNLYVAGNFDTAGGVPAGGFAKFDGKGWQDLSKDYPQDVYKPKVMAFTNGKLYAVADHINGFVAVNDGSGWKELPQVRDVATEREKVLAERSKRKADEEAARKRRNAEAEAEKQKDPSVTDERSIAQVEPYDRGELYDEAINPRLEIKELAAIGNTIYIAGWFYRSDSAMVLKLGDAKWEPLPKNGTRSYRSIYGYRDTLYLLGRYQEYPHNNIAMYWDGRTWGYLHVDSAMSFAHLFHLQGRLMGYGSPTESRKTDGTYYEWTGSAWKLMTKSGIGGYSTEQFASNGMSTFAVAYLFDTAYWRGSNLIQQSLDPNDPHRFIVREMESDSTLGLWGSALAMTKYDGKLAVVGNISRAGRTPVNDVALWDGNGWTDLGRSQFNSRRYEWFSPIAAVARDKDLYIAGYGGSGVGKLGNHVFKWDGNKWDSLSKYGFVSPDKSSENPGAISELVLTTKGLYAAGGFDSIEKRPASSIAYYDGKSWRSLDGGVYNTNKSRFDESIEHASIGAMFEHEGKLYVGGSFSHAGKANRASARNVACWDGKKWQALGDGLPGNVQQLLECNGKIVAAGEFYPNGEYTKPGYTLARWNGTNWDLELSMDSGMGRNFMSMFVQDSDLYIMRLQQDQHGEGSYTWLLKETQAGCEVVEKMLGGPGYFFVDGDKWYANPSMFGGHHISHGFGIRRSQR